MAFSDKEFIIQKMELKEEIDFSYSGKIDEDIKNVLKYSISETNDDIFYTHIAKTLSLNEDYVELIKHYLASIDLLDYGTSPRGGWTTELGIKVLNYLENYKGKE